VSVLMEYGRGRGVLWSVVRLADVAPSGVAKVAEYRAIFGGAGSDLGPLEGGPYENCFTLSANSGSGCTLGAVFGR
jgi:hypothetical protein